MSYNGADLIFPHLGIVIQHLPNHITVFGFRIAFYGIIIGCGMILGLLLAQWDAKRRGQDPDLYLDFALYAIILSVIGARIYYVAFQWGYYGQHPAEILNIRGGGLAIYGGIIAAVLTAIVYTRIKKISFLQLADTGVLGLILGQAIGRWGNFFNAEAFGGYTDSLLAMRLKESIVNPSMISAEVEAHRILDNGVAYIQVHPTFFYESVWNLCALLFLIWFGKHRQKWTGEIFFLYLLLYGTGRFFIEGLRTDQLLIPGTQLAVSQCLSGVLVVVSCIVLIRRGQKVSRVQK